MTDVSNRIATIEKEAFGSHKALKIQLQKDLTSTEAEMNAAFKLQMDAASGTHAVQFYSEKIESLGSKKMEIKKQLAALNESDTNVISIGQVKKNLQDRSEAVTRGWSKLPDSQKRRALRRLIKDILIGPEGMDIYYFYNSLAEERSLGVLAVESGSPAKVLAFRGPRNRSKLQIENCLSVGVVSLADVERTKSCPDSDRSATIIRQSRERPLRSDSRAWLTVERMDRDKKRINLFTCASGRIELGDLPD